jgi:hypothetical protein
VDNFGSRLRRLHPARGGNDLPRPRYPVHNLWITPEGQAKLSPPSSRFETGGPPGARKDLSLGLMAPIGQRSALRPEFVGAHHYAGNRGPEANPRPFRPVWAPHQAAQARIGSPPGSPEAAGLTIMAAQARWHTNHDHAGLAQRRWSTHQPGEAHVIAGREAVTRAATTCPHRQALQCMQAIPSRQPSVARARHSRPRLRTPPPLRSSAPIAIRALWITRLLIHRPTRRAPEMSVPTITLDLGGPTAAYAHLPMFPERESLSCGSTNHFCRC